MTRILDCRDVGPDCDHVVRGETDEEVMVLVAVHAREVHGIDPVTPEVAARARGAIRDDGPLERHEPPHTTTGPVTAPKFGSAGSGGLEYEGVPEQHDRD